VWRKSVRSDGINTQLLRVPGREERSSEGRFDETPRFFDEVTIRTIVRERQNRILIKKVELVTARARFAPAAQETVLDQMSSRPCSIPGPPESRQCRWRYRRSPRASPSASRRMGGLLLRSPSGKHPALEGCPSRRRSNIDGAGREQQRWEFFGSRSPRLSAGASVWRFPWRFRDRRDRRRMPNPV
jgi:hypothetical protein